MKKNFIAITLIALFISMALTGCEKENVNPKSKSVSELAPELQELYKQMPQRDYGRISVIDGNILCFESKEQYERVINTLLNECEIWDSIFYNTYSYMKDDELSAWEEEIGYDEFLPLKVFEEKLGITGKMLFDEQVIALTNWMENGLKGPDPTDGIFNLEAEQAIHNVNREVCVDDTLYQFRFDALVIVPISQLDMWGKYRKVSTSELPDFCIIKRNDKPSPSSDVPDHFLWPYTNDKTDNKITFSDFPNALGVNDYSHWSVVGKQGLTYSHIMTSKLVNYEGKYDKHGNLVFDKKRRYSSIITQQTFYTEQYEQFYQSFQGWFVDLCHSQQPKLKKVKTRSKRVRYQHLPINYLTSDYYFGFLKENATVDVFISKENIDQTQITPISKPLQ